MKIPVHMFVFTGFEVRPFGWHFRAVQQLFIDDKRDGAGVGQCPVTVFVLGPGRDLLPGGGFVRLGHAFGHSDSDATAKAVADKEMT